MHNNLRITRILKSLGELGFEHFQAPLVRFFLEETLVRKTLSAVKRSVLDYFLFAVRDKRERRKLVRFAFQHFEPKDKFVWCPRKIQKRFKKKSEKRQNSLAGSGESATTDEGHSRYKHKDGDDPSEPTHSKPVGDVTDAKKQADSDSVMRDDSEKPEGSPEDHEPSLDAPPVELPLNNDTSANNGEIVSLEPSSAEGGELPEVPQTAERAEEVSNTPWECAAGSTAGSSDCDDSRDEMDSPADSQKELEDTSADRTVTDSPKHSSPTPPEKGPSDQREKSGPPEDHQKNGMNAKQTNGSEKEEPMDLVDMSS